MEFKPHDYCNFSNQRLQGKKVLFVTGTDEHGEKIALSAADKGKTPQEHVDFVAEEYKSLWEKVQSYIFSPQLLP